MLVTLLSNLHLPKFLVKNICSHFKGSRLRPRRTLLSISKAATKPQLIVPFFPKIFCQWNQVYAYERYWGISTILYKVFLRQILGWCTASQFQHYWTRERSNLPYPEMIKQMSVSYLTILWFSENQLTARCNFHTSWSARRTVLGTGSQCHKSQAWSHLRGFPMNQVLQVGFALAKQA